MINFRYHLVSLIAVFLALAVGVVLGAGPLQNAINRQGEKDEAAWAQADLEAALAVAVEASGEGEVFADAVSDQVLPGTLEGAKVAIVALPGVNEADLEGLGAALGTAGANVLGTVWVTDAMVSQEQNTYRETLASPISAHLTARPVDGSAANVLATGLVEVLTGAGTEVGLIKEIIADEAMPLVEADSFPDEPAEVLILAGPATFGDAVSEGGEGGSGVDAAKQSRDDSAPASGAELPPMTRDAWIALATAIQLGADSSVAVGQAVDPADLISVLRTNGVVIATVDQGGSQMAALNATLVLVSGAEGAFGQQEGATKVLAPLP